MKLIAKVTETCEEMQSALPPRLLDRKRLDSDTDTEYQQGNYFLIATVCCHSKRHKCNFVALPTYDIYQGQF